VIEGIVKAATKRFRAASACPGSGDGDRTLLAASVRIIVACEEQGGREVRARTVGLSAYLTRATISSG